MQAQPNKEQSAVVEQDIRQNMKIIACAGSGKTTTIIWRIRFLLERGVDPASIVMTAFNVEAAAQIREKLRQIVGPAASGVQVSNIDKLAKGILSKYDKDKLLHVKEYLPHLLQLLQKNAGIVAHWKYFFMDEIQDIDPKEYELVRFLHAQGVVVTLVGDDAQNIYSFRDSMVQIIQVQADQDIKGIRTHLLTTNYRSTPEIVAVANAIVAHSKVLTQKRMVPFRSSVGRKPYVARFSSHSQQNQWIISEIRELVMEQGKRQSQIAVLCRSNKPLQFFEEALELYNKSNMDEAQIAYVSLITDKANTSVVESKSAIQTQNAIVISTIHKSKGLEWDTVYLINCNDEFFPGKGDPEEERRVFYVGVTRAKTQLTISYLGVGASNCGSGLSASSWKITRFVSELDQQLLDGLWSVNQPLASSNAFSQKCEPGRGAVLRGGPSSLQSQHRAGERSFHEPNLQALIEQISAKEYENLRERQILQQFEIASEQLHIQSCLGHQIMQNNLQADFARFIKKYMARALAEKFQLDAGYADSYADAVVGHDENVPQGNPFFLDDATYKLIRASYERFRDRARTTDKILEDVYHVSICQSIYTQRKRILFMKDAFKIFALNFQIIKNIAKRYVLSLPSALAAEHDKVYLRHPLQGLDALVTSEIDLALNGTLHIFKISIYQGIKVEWIVYALIQYSLCRLCHSPPIDIDTIKIYNPISGFTHTFSVKQWNKHEELLQIVAKLQRDRAALQNPPDLNQPQQDMTDRAQTPPKLSSSNCSNQALLAQKFQSQQLQSQQF